MNQTNISFGFSTYCLRRTLLSFDDSIGLCLSMASDALELSFPEPNELLNFQVSDGLAQTLRDVPYLAIHLPWNKLANYPTPGEDVLLERKQVLAKAMSINELIKPKAFIIHPEGYDFQMLKDNNLPFLLENPDKKPETWFNKERIDYFFQKFLEELYHLKSQMPDSWNFVFNAENAFYAHKGNPNHPQQKKLAADGKKHRSRMVKERGSDIYLDKMIRSIMKDRIGLVHVGGESTVLAPTPVYDSVNKVQILDMLDDLRYLPWIAEWNILTLGKEVDDKQKSPSHYKSAATAAVRNIFRAEIACVEQHKRYK